tara:strand:- start:582 stop:896 length:315 start_codon:yes stop_codon:yes gene_type:complete
MVLVRHTICILLFTAASLFRAVAKGLEDLRSLALPKPSPTNLDLPDTTADLVGEVRSKGLPPWAIEESPGDYAAWYVEQLELQSTAPHRVSPTFERDVDWVRSR